MKLAQSLLALPSVLAFSALACSPADTTQPRTRVDTAALTICDSKRAVWQMPTPFPPVLCADVATMSGLWKGSALFPGATPMRLQAYCAYGWNAAPGVPPDVTKLQQQRPGAKIDCPVVSTLSDNLSDEPAIWKPLQSSFHAQAAKADSFSETKASVRVAVLDTAAVPYSSSELDNNPHGRAVGRTIGDLTCGGGTCLAEVSNQLALPRTPDGEDWTYGGHFGTRGDLAKAIYAAIEDWKDDYKAQVTSAERLVLNMSLGWSPEWGGDTDPKKMPLPVLAVWEALQYARCHGALPVAAAGNYSAPSSSGPMYPALWESVPAPNEATCAELTTWIPGGQPTFASKEGGLYSPLVLAAGAVDWQDRPLGNSRELGQPRLLAYGQAVVTDDDRTGHTTILSGTSMSAAVVSASAAAAWAYRPDLAPTEVLNVLYDTATTLNTAPSGMGRATEFCLGSSCEAYPPRRVSLCDATRYTACDGAESCAGAPACATVPAHWGTDPAVPADWMVFGGFTWLASTPCTGDCSTEGTLTQTLVPEVGPQPQPGCDICSVDLTSSILWVSLEPRLAALSSKILLTTTNGRDRLQVRVPLPAGASSYPVRFAANVLVLPDARDAYLDFVMADGTLLLDARVSIPVVRSGY